VQRALLVLDQQGATNFFGEKALSINDLMRVAADGRGYISELAADQLMQSPQLYATFLLWLMSELFEALPEVGDPAKPKLVFFFDEAHLLFNGAPKALVDKVEQVVKLIRSKGVGIYFVTQNPVDIPEAVLAQLGNRVQHALRAYTPREQQAVKVAADTFRANPAFSTADVISQLGTGEALVSMLEEGGIPSIVGRTLIRPPSSRLGPISPGERQAIIAASPVGALYDEVIDRESAYEVLKGKQAQQAPPTPNSRTSPANPGAPRPSNREGMVEAATKSFTRAMASSAGRQVMNTIGRELVRGVLGSLMRGR
jgi:DNA helicase HerA-like ATPase